MKIPKDILWKGVIEDFFPDLMAFFYPDVLSGLDLSRVEFLDKELHQLFPESEDSRRYADKLIKIRRKDGKEQWQLIHIEVQGYKDELFEERMFRYFYRIYDRFGMPIEALALFTDSYKGFHPKYFELKSFHTHLRYQFHTFKLLEQESAVLEKSSNPFSHILFIAQKFLRSGKLTDEHLVELKLELFRKMLGKGYSKEYINRLMYFIKHYVRFSKPEMNHIFDKGVSLILKNDLSMGIVESVKDYIYKEGKKEGKIEGKLEGKIELVKNLLLSDLFQQKLLSYTEIAKISGLSEKEIVDIHSTISSED